MLLKGCIQLLINLGLLELQMLAPLSRLPEQAAGFGGVRYRVVPTGPGKCRQPGLVHDSYINSIAWLLPII